MRISHFGIEIDRTHKPPRAEAGKVRLGFIGQIAPHKGAHLILDALRRCGRNNLSLTIWGPENRAPAYAERLRAQAHALPVTFRGTVPRSELAGALGSIDYLVIPSTWYENSPLILLQALATHTPAIVSDVPGMTEFVEHGRNGFHFERGSVDSLVRILQSVADEPELVDRLAAATSYEQDSGRHGQGRGRDVWRQWTFLNRAASTGPSPSPLIARRWIDAVWSKWYDVEVVPGGIHGFQDVVVWRRR